MTKGFEIGVQEKKAKLFNEWEMFTSTDGESIESYYHHFLKLMNNFKRNKHFLETIANNLKFFNNLQPEWRRHVTIVHQTKDWDEADYTQLYDFLKSIRWRCRWLENGLIVVLGIANQNANQNGNGNIVAARAEGDLDEIEEVNENCILMANLSKHRHRQYTKLLEPIFKPHQVQQNDSNVISAMSIVEPAKFVRDFKSLAKEAVASLDKHKALECEIERLLRDVVSQDIMSIVQNNSVVDTSNLQTKLDRTKEKLETCIIKKEKNMLLFGMIGKPPSTSGTKLYYVTPFPKPVTSHSVDNFVPNKHVKANDRTKPITVSQPYVITKKDVNSNTNVLPSTGVESTDKTRRPQPRSNAKNDRIPSASKSSCLSYNLEKVEEHHRNLLFFKTSNHSVNQMKHKAHVKKSKKLSFEERLASPRPNKPRTCLRWLSNGRIFDLCGTINASSNIESESDTSVCDNASASNPQEPTSKGFPNSTSFLDKFTRLQRHNMCLYPLVVL
ncbi:hypothetical protein Tco_1437705 [Tanacetum coccineum]